MNSFPFSVPPRLFLGYLFEVFLSPPPAPRRLSCFPEHLRFLPNCHTQDQPLTFSYLLNRGRRALCCCREGITPSSHACSEMQGSRGPTQPCPGRISICIIREKVPLESIIPPSTQPKPRAVLVWGEMGQAWTLPPPFPPSSGFSAPSATNHPTHAPGPL